MIAGSLDAAANALGVNSGALLGALLSGSLDFEVRLGVDPPSRDNSLWIVVNRENVGSVRSVDCCV